MTLFYHTIRFKSRVFRLYVGEIPRFSWGVFVEDAEGWGDRFLVFDFGSAYSGGEE